VIDYLYARHHGEIRQKQEGKTKMMKLIEAVNHASDWVANMTYDIMESMAQKSRASLARRRLVMALVQSEAIK
jgi:hypothetical protein